MAFQVGRNNGFTGLADVQGYPAKVNINVTKWSGEFGCVKVPTTGRVLTINGLSSLNNETSVNGDEWGHGDFVGHIPTWQGSSAITPFVAATAVLTLTEQLGIQSETFQANLTGIDFSFENPGDPVVSGRWEKTGAMTAPAVMMLPGSDGESDRLSGGGGVTPLTTQVYWNGSSSAPELIASRRNGALPNCWNG